MEMRVKPVISKVLAAMVLAILAWLLLVAAGGSRAPLEPNKLVILSTTDVKGKTGPCG